MGYAALAGAGAHPGTPGRTARPHPHPHSKTDTHPEPGSGTIGNRTSGTLNG
jgi:hypothetical protein